MSYDLAVREGDRPANDAAYAECLKLSPDQRFRAGVVNIDRVVRAFTGFPDGDPAIAVRYSWRPFVVGP
ncbi:hypothetical protein [Winogradskya humida]|uniref:Uncharacterized protein n=1 Tax=Winogradskya humida TaxID=113566 RepID=A0ABQ3ZZA0_9ACTN|nr:hypothetical protein [Actinoplanes humidus]GIE23936.1 hypothetical protein Ahu01nite_070380 [Actinoplanes humidus]